MHIKGIFKNIGIKSDSNSFALFTDDVFTNQKEGTLYLKEDRTFAYYGTLEQCLIGLKKHIIRTDNIIKFENEFKDLIDYQFNDNPEVAIDSIDKVLMKLDEIDNKIIDFVNDHGESCLPKKNSFGSDTSNT